MSRVLRLAALAVVGWVAVVADADDARSDSLLAQAGTPNPVAS
jgi:hypothetical protein